MTASTPRAMADDKKKIPGCRSAVAPFDSGLGGTNDEIHAADLPGRKEVAGHEPRGAEAGNGQVRAERGEAPRDEEAPRGSAAASHQHRDDDPLPRRTTRSHRRPLRRNARTA